MPDEYERVGVGMWLWKGKKMAEQREDFHGALFRVMKKEKPSHPDFKGEASLGGIKYRLAGWNRRSKEGANYVSLAFTVIAPTEPPYHAPKSAYPVVKKPDPEEDIPL